MFIPFSVHAPNHAQSLITPQQTTDLLQSALSKTPLESDRVTLSEAAKAPQLELTPISQRPTAQQSADVILGFIGQHLQREAAEGATVEELQTTLDHALKGFQQGRDEALEIIEGLGLMTEDLAISIAETERLVREGLDQLQQQLIGSNSTQQQDVVTPTASKVVSAYSSESVSASSSVASRSGNGRVQAAAVSYAESYSRSESVDLQVLTQDGDRITLSYSSAFSSSQSASAAFARNDGVSAVAASFSSSSSSSLSFSLSIEGHLDQGEQQALNDLLLQIEELADEFFGGDLNAAFELALELDMDFTELAAMSLDLNQSTTQSAAASYSAVQQLADDVDNGQGKNRGVSELVHAGQFISRLLDSMEKAAENFSQPSNLLSNLLANQVAQRSPDNVEEPASLLDRLLERLA
jgi:hypothetical protein